ncbi:MAG TPA: metallophosphoesterase [Candidatus Limnocylindrales bacterium]|nr:metallophosphoesterase [Candidatus Limnocylindrales bacterium]
MTIKLALILSLVGALFGQELAPAPAPPAEHPTFLQMSDPQFGMFTNNAGFEQETANFEFAIATANRLKPAFVVVTGDLTNKSADPVQIAEYKRIAGKLNPAIKLFSVPGNHDVGNEPTEKSLTAYRAAYGPDYYTFHCGGVTGIVLNSNLEKAPQNVPAEASKMEGWFAAELAKARAENSGRIIVFQHIPLFLKDPDEADQYFNIPKDVRARYLKILHQFNVTEMFAGHLHHNSEGRDGTLDMVTTGAVGKPLGGKSGIRYVTLTGSEIQHKFYEFGELR